MLRRPRDVVIYRRKLKCLNDMQLRASYNNSRIQFPARLLCSFQCERVLAASIRREYSPRTFAASTRGSVKQALAISLLPDLNTTGFARDSDATTTESYVPLTCSRYSVGVKIFRIWIPNSISAGAPLRGSLQRSPDPSWIYGKGSEGKEGEGEMEGSGEDGNSKDCMFSVIVQALAHDRLLSRTVSVELQQNEVSMSVHTLCAVRQAYRELSQQPFLTPAAGDQPLAYKFPFVTNHHIVIKDRLMLIFCVYRVDLRQ